MQDFVGGEELKQALKAGSQLSPPKGGNGGSISFRNEVPNTVKTVLQNSLLAGAVERDGSLLTRMDCEKFHPRLFALVTSTWFGCQFQSDRNIRHIVAEFARDAHASFGGGEFALLLYEDRGLNGERNNVPFGLAYRGVSDLKLTGLLNTLITVCGVGLEYEFESEGLVIYRSSVSAMSEPKRSKVQPEQRDARTMPNHSEPKPISVGIPASGQINFAPIHQGKYSDDDFAQLIEQTNRRLASR
ncbi:MAG: hypothetical protein AAF441_15635 [Pseudomonadota bacterium]